MLFNAARAQAKLAASELDAFVVTTSRNFYYVSEYWSYLQEFKHQEPAAGAVVPRGDIAPATMIVPLTGFGFLEEYPTWIPQIRPIEFLDTAYLGRQPDLPGPLTEFLSGVYAEKLVHDVSPNLVEAMVATLEECGLAAGRVAFDDLRVARHVAARLPSLRVEDAHDLLIDIRVVKTDHEIARLRRGVEINQGAVEHVLPLIKPDAAWSQVAAEFRGYVEGCGGEVMRPEKALQLGAEFEGEFYPELAIGDTEWTVREGQPIIFESWGRYQGYSFDFSRTVHVGKASAEYRSACDTLLAVWRESVVSVLGPGVHTRELFETSLRLAETTDVPTPLRTLPFFHSIGLDIIELPTGFPAFGEVKDFVLEPGMVINGEFLYFGRTLAPYHLETTYLITETGAEMLQTLPEELVELT